MREGKGKAKETETVTMKKYLDFSFPISFLSPVSSTSTSPTSRADEGKP